jgi:hypothetical protein
MAPCTDFICPDEQIGLEMMIDLTTFAFAQSVNPEFTLH